MGVVMNQSFITNTPRHGEPPGARDRTRNRRVFDEELGSGDPLESLEYREPSAFDRLMEPEGTEVHRERAPAGDWYDDGLKSSVVRTFSTGANRDVDTDKLDFEGFLSPIAIEAFGLYMHKNRFLRDGSFRDSDNWQRGIPLPVYVKSGWRHFFDWWRHNRGLPIRETLIEALCGLLFNVFGYLHEYLKANPEALEAFRQSIAEKAKSTQDRKELT